MAVGNNVVFVGRFTRDPELRNVGNGDTKVCSFALARNRSFNKDKDHPESDFIDCVAWNKIAETICNYFHKGSRIGVSGELQTRNYDDKNGIKHKVTEIVVNSIEFIDPKSFGENKGSGNTSIPDKSASAPVEEEDDGGLPF